MKTLYPFIKQLRFLTALSIFFLAFTLLSAAKGSTNMIFTTVDSKNIQVINMNGQVVKNRNNHSGQELKIISLKARIYSIAINNTMISEKETVHLVVTR